MATGYTRQSSSTILATKPVAAAPVSAEFNQLVSAFDETDGHAHDGTAAGGANVPMIADTGDTRVQITGDAVEIMVSGTVIARFINGNFFPATGVNVDFGDLTNRFGTLYVTGVNASDVTVPTGGTLNIKSGSTVDFDGVVITNIGTASNTGEAVDLALLNSTIASNLVLSSTSASSNTVNSGDLTFVLADSMDISSGPFVTVSDTADAENYVFGQVITWTSGTKTAVVRVHAHSGSGTISSWNFNISGVEGPEADTTNLLNISGDTLLNTTLSGVLTAATGSSLDVNGSMSVENTGHFEGDIAVVGDANVAGSTTVQALSAASVTVSGNLTVTGDSSLYNVHVIGGEKYTVDDQTGLVTGSQVTLSSTGNTVLNIDMTADTVINVLPADTGEMYVKVAVIDQGSVGGRLVTVLFNSGTGNTGGVYYDDGVAGAAFEWDSDAATVARSASFEVFTDRVVVSVGGNYKAV